MTLRPHVITLLGISAVLFTYVKFRYNAGAHVAALYWLPVIFLFWANMHPGVTSGMFLLGLITVFEIGVVLLKRYRCSLAPLERRPLVTVLGIFLLSILTTLLNPHGINTFIYAYSHTQMKLLSVIIEWMPPFGGAPASVTLTLYKIALGLGIIGSAVLLKKRDLLPVILIIGFGLYSLRAVRFIADFSIVSSLGIALALEHTVHHVRWAGALLRSKPAVLMLVVLLVWMSYAAAGGSVDRWLGTYRHFGVGIDEQFFSPALIEFLRAQKIQGRPFNQLEIGGYLLWEHPEDQNFIDSRNVSDTLGKEYYRILELRPQFGVLRHAPFDVVEIAVWIPLLRNPPHDDGHLPFQIDAGQIIVAQFRHRQSVAHEGGRGRFVEGRSGVYSPGIGPCRDRRSFEGN